MKSFVVGIFAISCSIFMTNAFPNHEQGPGYRPPPHSWNSCQPPDCNGTSCSAAAIPGQGVTHVGTPYDPSPILGLPDDEDEPANIPNANPQGPFIPSGPAINLTQIDGNAARVNAKGRRQSCGGGSIFFDTSTVFSNSASQPPEPSGARAGNIIFTTANLLAAISLDDGLTFNTIDPTVYSGPHFCCDQVVQYLPSIDRFAWVIQYWDDATSSRNKLRVITFHPRDVTATSINSWLYADFNEGDFNGVTTDLDQPGLVIGGQYFYLSASPGALVVLRLPIAAFDVVGTFTYSYTNVNDGTHAIRSYLTQNPGDTVFWAGHSTYGTNMQIFRWPDSENRYYWNDLRIKDWPSDPANFVSFCPSPLSTTNWAASTAFATIKAATRRSSTEVWFAWNAPSGNGFPNPHIQIVQIDVGSWPIVRLILQWQIWNSDFAFIYPAMYTNECADVGVAAMFGGGTSGLNPSSAVGIIYSEGLLTKTLYYPELSQTCENRNGDYLTVRSDVGAGFQGYVYAEQPLDGGGIQRNARYVVFQTGTNIG